MICNKAFLSSLHRGRDLAAGRTTLQKSGSSITAPCRILAQNSFYLDVFASTEILEDEVVAFKGFRHVLLYDQLHHFGFLYALR